MRPVSEHLVRGLSSVCVAALLWFPQVAYGGGSVISWCGNNISSPGVTNVVAISAGANHNLVLKANGTVVGWGGAGANVPAGLTNVIAVSAGRNTSLALTGEGKLVGWNLGIYSPDPAALSNIVAISAGP